MFKDALMCSDLSVHVQACSEGPVPYTISLNRKSNMRAAVNKIKILLGACRFVFSFLNVLLSSHFMNIDYHSIFCHMVKVMNIHESMNYIRHQVSLSQ